MIRRHLRLLHAGLLNLGPLATALFLALSGFSPAAADGSDLDSVYVDIDLLFPGTYSNAGQLTRHDGGDDAFALTTIVKRLTNPALGETLYYLEEFRDNDPAAVTRIRIYSFFTEGDIVRLRLLNPIDVEDLQGAHNDIRRAEALTMDDIHVDRDVCLLDMSRYGDTLVARMRYRACDIGDIYNDYELILDGTGSWTCYARRQLSDDSLVWLQMPAFPCVRQERAS